MTPNWFYSLTPDMLAPVGYAAWGALLAGLILWLFGVAIARIAVAAALGTLFSGIAILVSAHLNLPVPPVAMGITGFAVGAIAGAAGFRVLQGFTLAVVLSLAVAGLYYHWQVGSPVPAPLTQLPVENLKISLDALPDHPVRLNAPAHINLARPLLDLKAHLFAMSLADQKHMALAAAGAGIIAMLLAFGFPKMTTATISAVVGSLFILTAANLFMLTHQVIGLTGRLPTWWPSHLSSWALLLTLLAGLGLLIQYRFFIRSSDKPQVKAA